LLSFYLDSALTIPASSSVPKKFLVPTAGMTKSTTVYLGDPYSTFLALPAASAATTLTLDDTSEFLASGNALVGSQTVTYTAVVANQLTGVTGLALAATVGTVVRPLKTWVPSGSQTVIYSGGADAAAVQVAMRVTGTAAFNFPGMPLILAATPIQNGVTPLSIDVQVTVPAGSLAVFSNWDISTSAFVAQTVGATSTPTSTEAGVTAILAGYILRQDQQLPQMQRLLPLNRSVATALPGFKWGTYRWRNQDQVNQQMILPSNWGISPASVGAEKFIAGVGMTDDLEPIGIVQENDSVYLEVNRGFYFTGINDYYLPGTPQLDFLASNSATLQLSQTPQRTLPLFVGTYQLDSQGYYEKATEYRYQTAAAVAAGTNLPALYYTLNRANNTITLNQPMTAQTLFLGAISGDVEDYFNLPIYPVGQVTQVYVQAAAGTAPIIASNWAYDEDLGTITITSPSGVGPSVAGTSLGMSVFAVCTPALAVLYDTAPTSSLVVDSVDLNPAFAGLSSGYVYLAQTRQEAASLVLSCDKPLIPVPATLSSIIGLIAYGPVYFNGDYALLQVTAYSGVSGETLSNVQLEVVVDPTTFTGLINYVDPITTPVTVTTGADGIANLIFTPLPNYGLYIPTAAATGSLAGLKTTTLANDTIVLPQAVPISQMWNATDGWLVSVYQVLNNNPVYGMVGADVNAGQVAFATSGTPGESNYRTNGALQLWLNPNNILQPIQALDADGNNYTATGFSGNVVSLVYGQSLPTTGAIAAYFLSFLQRTVIKVQEANSNVVSNSIMLQMQMPPQINDETFLILNNATDGILNQYRLGMNPSSS